MKRSVWLAALGVATCSVHADDPPTLPKVEVVGSYDNEIGVWDSASQGAVTSFSTARSAACVAAA